MKGGPNFGFSSSCVSIRACSACCLCSSESRSFDDRMDFHEGEVKKRCRVCGRRLDKGRVPVSVESAADNLLVAFGIDSSTDDQRWFPTKLCSGCSRYAERLAKTEAGSTVPRTSMQPQSGWPQGDDCELCERWKKETKGGRRARNRTAAGRRSRPDGEGAAAGGSGKGQIALEQPAEPALVDIAEPSDPALASRLVSFAAELELDVDRFTAEVDETQICPICRCVLNQPMEVPLGCEHRSCKECWRAWLAHSPTCPVCRKPTTHTMLRPMSRRFLSSLSALELHCDFLRNGCNAPPPPFQASAPIQPPARSRACLLDRLAHRRGRRRCRKLAGGNRNTCH